MKTRKIRLWDVELGLCLWRTMPGDDFPGGCYRFTGLGFLPSGKSISASFTGSFFNPAADSAVVVRCDCAVKKPLLMLTFLGLFFLLPTHGCQSSRFSLRFYLLLLQVNGNPEDRIPR